MVIILLQNVCGLRDNQKRKEVFIYAKQKADIVCLQETHSMSEDEKFWRNQWHGVTFYVHGTEKSRGVFVGIKSGTPISVEKVISDKEGRYVIVQYEHQQKRICFSKYICPNRDIPQFFVSLFKKLEDCDGARILCGDFNVVLDPEVDRYSKRGLVSNNKLSMETINSYIEDTQMVDIWRITHPDKQSYTYRQRKPLAMSRIDYFLIEQAIASWIKEASIGPGYKSDHSHILLNIVTYNVGRGEGVWKLNNRLLYEQEYVQIINEKIERAQMLGQNLEPDELFEVIKLECMNFSKIYAKEHAQKRKLILSQLEHNIKG